MSPGKINKALLANFRQHKYKLTNSYVFKWEADFFSVTQSEYTYEIEIKVSKSDYKADFAKIKKHDILKAFYEKGHMVKKGYYQDIFTPRTNVDIKTIDNTLVPNRFFYACPDGLIVPGDVPKYAGLIYIRNRIPTVFVAKPAPFIHKEKQIRTAKMRHVLLEKFYWKSIDQKTIIHDQNLTIQNLRNELEYVKEKSIKAQAPAD